MSVTTPSGRFAHRRYGAGDGSGAERRRRTARQPPDALGWADDFADAWESLGSPGRPGGSRASIGDGAPSSARWPKLVARREPMRLRNIGADVAVGDWIVPSRRRRARRARARAAECVHSASVVRRHARRVAHARGEHRRRVPRARARIAAEPASPRTRTRPGVRLGCRSRRRADEDRPRRRLAGRRGRRSSTSPWACRCCWRAGSRATASRRSGRYAAGNRTLTFLGASGVGKSTLVNALRRQRTPGDVGGARGRPAWPAHDGRRRTRAAAG